MESQLIQIGENCTEANGYGKDADCQNVNTKYLRFWAKFYD